MATRRDAQRKRMRTRLLEAALALFEAQGYEATTIDQIANKADVARQTVLNHYPLKRDFIDAWGANRRERLLNAFESGAGFSARDELARAFALLAAINEGERDLSRALRQQMFVPQPVPEMFALAVEKGQADGAFSLAFPPAEVAEIFAGIYFDTLQRWLAPDEPPFDLTQTLTRRAMLVLDGLES